MNKPGLPTGTRDFGPDVMVKRNFIFSVVRNVFNRFGFLPIETPAMENLDTLTGKYGEEGDQLIFKILNNGDFLAKANEDALNARQSLKLAPSICDRALRYDLTVPFARFVVMNRNELTFPFRRFQIQPVWRADRPQKGRYREFYQCDADIIGSESLLNEVDLVLLYDTALSELGLPSFAIRLNNRKILAGLAEVAGIPDRMLEMTIAIDKLDKVGVDGVKKELAERGFSPASVDCVVTFFSLPVQQGDKLDWLATQLAGSEIGLKGVEELRFIMDRVNALGLKNGRLELDVTLARGLNYYTGAIFEVKADGVQIGSIGGGGRYDDLTGIFGWKGMSGVGISFGADRIYDVMNELGIFPEEVSGSTRVLITRMEGGDEIQLLKLLYALREKGVPSEIYPDESKLKKQFKYADDKNIPYVVLLGEDEVKSGTVTVRNMKTGEQSTMAPEQVLSFVQ